jgi:hypothetical protein
VCRFHDVTFDTLLDFGLDYEELCYQVSNRPEKMVVVFETFRVRWPELVAKIVRPYTVAANNHSNDDRETELCYFLHVGWSIEALAALGFSLPSVFEHTKSVSKHDFSTLCKKYPLDVLVNNLGLEAKHLFFVDGLHERNVSRYMYDRLQWSEDEVRDRLGVRVTVNGR